jgi:hypothetical protein
MSQLSGGLAFRPPVFVTAAKLRLLGLADRRVWDRIDEDVAVRSGESYRFQSGSAIMRSGRFTIANDRTIAPISKAQNYGCGPPPPPPGATGGSCVMGNGVCPVIGFV